jgi:hypothetical protein
MNDKWEERYVPSPYRILETRNSHACSNCLPWYYVKILDLPINNEIYPEKFAHEIVVDYG